MTNRSNGSVHITYRSNTVDMQFDGLTVGEAKLALRETLGIPYFAEAFIDGVSVPMGHTLAGSNDLRFVTMFGAKGGEERPNVQADGLLKTYPDLQQQKNPGALLEWFEKKFGPVPDEVMQILARLFETITKLEGSEDRIAARVAERLKPPNLAGFADVMPQTEAVKEMVHYDPIKKLPRCVRLAASAYDWAIDQKPNLKTDQEVYEHVREFYDQTGEDYELPSLDTFTRYLRQHRKATDTNKNMPRAGRGHGRSIVRHDEL